MDAWVLARAAKLLLKLDAVELWKALSRSVQENLEVEDINRVPIIDSQNRAQEV
jgi:hypothetical protein